MPVPALRMARRLNVYYISCVPSAIRPNDVAYEQRKIWNKVDNLVQRASGYISAKYTCVRLQWVRVALHDGVIFNLIDGCYCAMA